MNLQAENKRLRRKRGLDCGCSGRCTAHDQGLGLRIRAKRKTFDQLSKYGKRKSMVEVRALLNRKQKEYTVPVSKLAGYVIQQVSSNVEMS